MFPQNLKVSAIHHLEAAGKLSEAGRKDIAGYLYGWSAECAVKQIMLDSGMRPATDGERRNDPFFAHFEELKTLLRDAIRGRRGADLRKLVDNSSFMQHWHTSMRYSDGKCIQDRWIERWKLDAKLAVEVMLDG